MAHPEYFGREVRETMDEAAVLIFCRCLIVLKVLLRSALSPDHTFNIRTFFFSEKQLKNFRTNAFVFVVILSVILILIYTLFNT